MLLVQPTAVELSALAGIGATTYWNCIEKYLERELAAVLDQLTSAPSEALVRQLQGRGQELKGLLQLIRSAPQQLQSLGASTPL